MRTGIGTKYRMDNVFMKARVGRDFVVAFVRNSSMEIQIHGGR